MYRLQTREGEMFDKHQDEGKMQGEALEKDRE